MKLKLKNKNQYEGYPLGGKHEIKRVHKEYLTFNFSFLTKDSDYNLDKSSKTIDKRVRLKLLERITDLSSKDIVEVLNLRREEGFERIDEKQVKISVNQAFIQSKRHLECDDGYWIFRLNKLGRVIGMKNGNIYYLLAIDTKFKMYNHG